MGWAKACMAALATTTLFAAAAPAATIEVRSAGAPEPGLRPAAEQFRQAAGHVVNLRFGTPMSWRQRVAEGEVADVLIATPPVVEELTKLGKLAETPRVQVGRVGVGVAVRDGAPQPEVGNVAALQRAVLEAESVVFNRASTGTYLDRLFQRLGIAEQIAPRAIRPADGAGVMEELIKGRNRQVGLGAITEIKLYVGKGVTYVAPLPAEVQNYTTYLAAPFAAAAAKPEVAAFLQFLAGPAQPIMRENGVE